MSGDAEILDLDATGQLAALASRRISAVELLKLSLARHERTHARLNAVVAADLERALERARGVDDLRDKGLPVGVLAGLPMTIKDTLDVQGLPASSGVEALKRRKPEDAVVVALARRAGAVIWGKTNVPVMAGDWQSYNALYGATNNPWDLTRTPGGSSGGAAAALAAGVTSLEIGSDIGGSLRVPASFCGVFSHKPTWATVSQVGHVPPRPGAHAERDLNVVGPMARSARDLRLLLSVIGSMAGRSPAAVLPRLKIGLWVDEPSFPLDLEVLAVVKAFAAQVEAAGATVETIESPVDASALMQAYQVLLGAIIGTDMPPKSRMAMERMRGLAKLAMAMGAGTGSWASLTRAYTASHAEWLEADETRARMQATLEGVFSRYDLILAPVAPVAAFPHDHRPFSKRRLTLSDGRQYPYTAMLNWIALATALHLPATTVPAGFTPAGLPVGVQIIGPHGGDAKTLAAAQAFDEEIRGFAAPRLA